MNIDDLFDFMEDHPLATFAIWGLISLVLTAIVIAMAVFGLSFII